MGKLLAYVGVWIITSVIVRIFAALGLSVATYYGLNYVFENTFSLISNLMAGLPLSILQLLELAGLSQAMSIIMSGLLTGVSIRSARAFFGVSS